MEKKNIRNGNQPTADKLIESVNALRKMRQKRREKERWRSSLSIEIELLVSEIETATPFFEVILVIKGGRFAEVN